MAILSCNKIADGRKSGNQIKGIREYVQKYRLITDSPNDGQVTILAAQAAGLPLVFTRYADPNGIKDEFAFLWRVEIDQEIAENPYTWIATAEYTTDWSKLAGSNRGGSPGSGGDPANPLQRPAIIDFEDSIYQKVSQVSANGQSYVNSANDYYEPAPEEDDCRGIIRIMQNDLGFDAGKAASLRNSLNAISFFGNGPGNCKMNSIRAKSVFEQNWLFYTITFEIHVRTPYPGGLVIANAATFGTNFAGGVVPNPIPGWALVLVDKGFRKLVAGNPVPIVLNGFPPATPVLLDGNGGVAAAGQIKFNAFLQYPMIDWRTWPGRPIPLGPLF
jgi:hypothetical protein